jgi:hypothetical protein
MLNLKRICGELSLLFYIKINYLKYIKILKKNKKAIKNLYGYNFTRPRK